MSFEGYNKHSDGNPEALLSEESGIDVYSEWSNGWSWVAGMLFGASHIVLVTHCPSRLPTSCFKDHAPVPSSVYSHQAASVNFYCSFTSFYRALHSGPQFLT